MTAVNEDLGVADKIKRQERATWAAGDYDAAVDNIWAAGGVVTRAARVGADDEVLDVACGTGNAAIQAAQAGGRVTGVDLTPELFSAARRRAAAAGVEIDLVEGDAEHLPFEPGSFDVVLSTFGAMFAPAMRRRTTRSCAVAARGASAWPTGSRPARPGSCSAPWPATCPAATERRAAVAVGYRGARPRTLRRAAGAPVHPPPHPSQRGRSLRSGRPVHPGPSRRW